MATEIPVYLFVGFLESGKTKVIQETLEDPGFNSGEKTLLLVCEYGMTDFDTSRFAHNNVYIEDIENEKDLTKQYLTSLVKKHKATRVMIEYNGMWQLDSLYNAIGDNWLIYQQIFFADSTTFINYNNNMRSLVVDKLKNSELVIFNRPSPDTDKDAFHKIVRSVSRRIVIGYEYPDGEVEYDEKEDPLPFDVNAPVIEIKDRDYAFWFRDFSEDLKKYIGKTVRFKGIVGINGKMKPGDAICGRHVMTCCIEDIEFKGLVIEGIPAPMDISNRDWIVLTAKIVMKYHELYKKDGPVLKVINIEKSTVPEEEVATFY